MNLHVKLLHHSHINGEVLCKSITNPEHCIFQIIGNNCYTGGPDLEDIESEEDEAITKPASDHGDAATEEKEEPSALQLHLAKQKKGNFYKGHKTTINPIIMIMLLEFDVNKKFKNFSKRKFSLGKC